MNNYKSFLASNVVNIFEALDDGVYITDREGTTLHVNSMYEKLTGLTPEELLGQNVRVLREKGIFDIVLNPTIVKTQKPETNVQTLQDGKRVVLSGFPVFDDQNELVLVITLVRDVTLMEQMRAQIAQQKDLLSICHNQVELLSAKRAIGCQLLEMPQTDALIEQLEQVASTDATVLLMGETGVGKNGIARMIHDNSPRKDELFIRVDCSMIPKDRIEEALFGYVPEAQDAFTSADSEGKIGPFEAADRGTVLLDEIGALPVPMQEKVFRVMRSREVIRIGSPVIRNVNVRIIASTSRNLEVETEKGNFHNELNDRLGETVIKIPALCETPEVIPSLVKQVLEVYGPKYNRKMICNEAAISILEAYPWPGNIQELQNTIQNLMVKCEGNEIRPQDVAYLQAP